MTAEIHKGDIGTVFEVTVQENGAALNISSATTKQILLRKPSGTVLTKTASFVTDGTNGKISYTTVAGDLSEDGQWKIQAYIVLPTGSWHSDAQRFDVYPNLA